MDLLALPKTELHLHLEGAIPPEAYLELAHKYWGPEEIPDVERLRSELRHRDFPEFLRRWTRFTGLLREAEDLRRGAAAVARGLRAQGVRYAEVHLSSTDFARRGVPLLVAIPAARQGLDAGSAGDGLRVALIIDLVRSTPIDQAIRTVEQAADLASECDVVAVGLGGDEAAYPPELYTSAYRRAAELGLRRTAHAGEAAGPASVWGALRDLGCERIGHGVRSAGDRGLVNHLCETGVPLEVCPTSNVHTGAVPAFERHPLAELLRSGVRVSLSSDDPTFFETDVLREYTRAREELGLSDAELVTIARTGFEVAFVSDDERAVMLAEFDAAVGSLQGDAA